VWIIKPGRVKEFGQQYPDAATALDQWLNLAEASKWKSLNDVRAVLPKTDSVKVSSGKSATIFNIGGNKYRLIVAIHYNTGKIFVMRFLTHAEYSDDRWKGQL
jgi:mRNA interferase HigB